MSAQANYFKLGLFVIGAVALLLVGVVFFGGRALMREIVYMETYLDESVEGLEVGSAVNYRGVRIGRVERIGFVADEYGIEPRTPAFKKYGRYVMVILAIDVSTEDERKTATLLTELEKEGLRIRIKSHPLTNVAYLEADYLDPDEYPPMEIGWKPRNPYLPSAPSMLSTFARTAEDAFRKLARIDFEKLIKRLDKLIGTLDSAVTDANVGQVSRDAQALLKTLNTTVKDAKIGEISRDARKLLAAAEAAIKDAKIGDLRKDLTELIAAAKGAVKDAKIGEVSKETRELIAELRQSNLHLQAMLKTPDGAPPGASLAKTVADLDKVILRVDRLLKRQTPAISRTMNSLATVAEQLKKLVDDLERNPARLLFGGPPPRSRKVKP